MIVVFPWQARFADSLVGGLGSYASGTRLLAALQQLEHLDITGPEVFLGALGQVVIFGVLTAVFVFLAIWSMTTRGW